MKPNKHKQIVFFLICIILIFTACESSTKVKTGILGGKVVLINDTNDPLLDPTNFAGVTVSIYDLAKYDTDLRSYLSSYPSLGFALSQISEFDHHEGKVVVKTTSQEDGSFELTKIPVGKYNIVFEKSGWGYRYVYDVQIQEGDNQLIIVDGLVELYPERYVSGSISDTIVVENWHHLVVEGDTDFMPQSKLELRQNGVLRAVKNAQINIYGDVFLQGDVDKFFQIKLNHLTEKEEVDTWGYAHFNLMPGSSLEEELIQFGRISGGMRGIGLRSVEAATIKNCRFLIMTEGLYSTQGTSLVVENCIFSGLGDRNGDGINIFNIMETAMKHNCFMRLSKGIELSASEDASINNNGFLKVNYGVESYDAELDLQHNTFENNEVSIRVAGPSSPIVQYNQIEAEQGIVIGKSRYFMDCKPTINRNNISSSSYAITIVRHNPDDVDAKNNYFYSTDAQVVRKKIKHKPDYPQSQQGQTGNIIYEPFLFSKVRDAGIVNR